MQENIGDPVAAAVIVLLDSKILAFLRKKDGQIGLPCGMVEEGESTRETAIRECFEETGYEVAIPSEQVPFTGFDPKGKKDGSLFCGTYRIRRETHPFPRGRGYLGRSSRTSGFWLW